MPGVSLSSLKVVQLKAELEKRGLEKSGIKSILVDRLTEALLKESLDPENYEIQIHDEDESESEKDPKTASDDEERMQEKSSLMDQEIMPPPSPLVLTMEDSIAIKKAFHPSTSSANLSVADSMKVNVDDKEVAEMSQELTAEINAASRSSPTNQNESNVESVNEDQVLQSSSKTATNPQNGQKRKNMAKKTGKGTDAKLLWVGNIGTEIKAADLKDLIAKCGKVIVSRIVTMKSTGSSQDTLYGHLEMGSAIDVMSAIRMFDGTELKGRSLCVGNTLATVKKKMEKLFSDEMAVKEATAVTTEEADNPLEEKSIKQESPVKEKLSEREEQLLAEEKRLKDLRREIFLQKLEIQKASASLQYQLKRASTASQMPRRGGLSVRRGSGMFGRPPLVSRRPRIPSEAAQTDVIEVPPTKPIRLSSRNIPPSFTSRHPLSLRGRGAFQRRYTSSIIQRRSQYPMKRPASSLNFPPSKIARANNEGDITSTRYPVPSSRSTFSEQNSFKKPFPERTSGRFETTGHDNRGSRPSLGEGSFHESKMPRHSVGSSRSRYAHAELADSKFSFEHKRRSLPEAVSRKSSFSREHKSAFYTKSDRPGEYVIAQAPRGRRSSNQPNFEKRYTSSVPRMSRETIEFVRPSYYESPRYKNDERSKWSYGSPRSDFASSTSKGSYNMQYEARAQGKIIPSRLRRGGFERYSDEPSSSRKHFYSTTKRY